MPDEKSGPRLLTVKDARRITPGMIRVTFAGEALAGLPAGRDGANCKLSLQEPGESRAAFAVRLLTGPASLTCVKSHGRPRLPGAAGRPGRASALLRTAAGFVS